MTDCCASCPGASQTLRCTLRLTPTVWANLLQGWLKSSRKLAQSVGDPSRLRCKAKRKVAAFVGKQLVRVPPKQANSLYPPCTKEQATRCAPKSGHELARLVGDAMAPVQSKEEGRSLCRQAARASGNQVGTYCASTSHRKAAASLLDWSEIPDGSRAKQREEEAGGLCRQAAPASADQTGKQFSCTTN